MNDIYLPDAAEACRQTALAPNERDLYYEGLRASITKKAFTQSLIDAMQWALEHRPVVVKVTCRNQAEAVYARVILEMSLLQANTFSHREGCLLELTNGSAIDVTWVPA